MGNREPSSSRRQSDRAGPKGQWSFGSAHAGTSGGSRVPASLPDPYLGRGKSVAALEGIAAEIVACRLCPRLRRHCLEIASTRRAAYLDETYWGLPVPGFGDPRAWLVLIGLAPGAHGANRTGRMFTGDRSGEWLYRELHAQGLATRAISTRAGDGLRLRGVYITASGRCAPPGNKPTPDELERCRPYLIRELGVLGGVRVRLALGRVGHDAFLAARRAMGLPDLKPKPRFGHGVAHALPEGGWLLDSYHPSQQNTSTGVLTPAMWSAVFDAARRLGNRV